tara:strand:+ start:4759 stop:5517 length:759 start_codon:yes stop_codon:yes gene_type:complete
MKNQTIVTAAVILIGDEILSGRTKDANLNHLALWLGERGISLREARVIPDEGDVIVRTVNELRHSFDYVFTTGGIGPTHDDITAEYIARAFGVPFRQNPEAVKIMTDHYGKENLTEARLRMTMMPEGATLIANPVSRAPGFQMENVFVMAGIPVVMQAMLKDIEPRLVGGDKMHTITMHVYEGESFFAQCLTEVNEAFETVTIGSYPFHRNRTYGASFVLRSAFPDDLAKAAAQLKDKISLRGTKVYDGEPD